MKYKLTEKAITVGGQTLYRIQALKDFRNVKSGDLGGFVESEDNLSHDDNAWVFDKAKVFSDAKVFDHAKVFGAAYVLDNAEVFGNATIRGRASVLNDAKFPDKVDVLSVANITLEMSSGNIEDSSYFKKITLYHKLERIIMNKSD